jgi:hypothetical protein
MDVERQQAVQILSFLEKIQTNEPRSGDFGDGEKAADFLFVQKN